LFLHHIACWPAGKELKPLPRCRAVERVFVRNQ